MKVVLVSGWPGPFRAEQISDWTALGAVRNDPGHFRAGPRVARTILGRPESRLVRDQKRLEPARDQHYFIYIFLILIFQIQIDTFLWNSADANSWNQWGTTR